MTFLKTTALTGVVCIAAFLGYKFVTTDPPGYCESQKRVIPNEEIFTHYLDAKIKLGQLKLSASEITGRDYLENHPNCCRIDRSFKAKFRQDGLIYALFTKVSGYAEVTYEMSDSAKKMDIGATRHTALLTVDSCGKTYEYSGMSE